MAELFLIIAAIAVVILLVQRRDTIEAKRKADREADAREESRVIRRDEFSPSSKQTRPPTRGEKKADHPPPPEIPASRQLLGKAWVIDGDTIVVSKIKVRLAGIDAPELDQPWGQKSKWAMVRICKGQRIRVELTGETSYDRLVGTCYLDDGTDIGAELIKEGLALDGGHFSQGKYRHLEPEGIRRKLKRYGHWR